MKKTTGLWALALTLALAALAAEAKPAKYARLEPRKGGYFGLNLDWGTDSPRGAASRFGFNPKVLVRFFAFPLNDEDIAVLRDTRKLATRQQAVPLITLEPWGGLTTVTDEEADRFARTLRKVCPKAYIRFAHEMNGSWYPWCQQPTEYKRAFALLAKAVHKRAGQSAMIWAPNYGGGYPFSGGQYEAEPDSPDFPVLDTNHDGKLTAYDDPYAPYYPGAEAVDWVGMTLYHWGNQYPWGENEIPEANKFIDQLTGNYDGLNGDETMVPDFIADYSVALGKPMAIPETSALFVPALGPPGLEREIKEAWWNQVFSPDSRSLFPTIKMINWFEWRKAEAELGGAVVDWRVSHDPVMLEAFDQALLHANLNVKIKKKR